MTQAPRENGDQSTPSRSTTPRESPKAGRRRPAWLRLSGAGLELAACTILLGWLGSFFDQGEGPGRPLGVVMGGTLGFTIGMIRFIRLAISVSESERNADGLTIPPDQHSGELKKNEASRDELPRVEQRDKSAPDEPA